MLRTIWNSVNGNKTLIGLGLNYLLDRVQARISGVPEWTHWAADIILVIGILHKIVKAWQETPETKVVTK